MKRYLYTAGSAALMLALSGVPLLAAHAAEVEANVGVSGGTLNASASSTMHVSLPGEERSESNQERGQEGAGGMMASTSHEGVVQMREQNLSGNEHGNATSSAAREDALAQFAARFGDSFSASTSPVSSFSELMQSIAARRMKLDEEASSSATSTRILFEHASPVAVAVHALLASKDLMGSTTIGARISVIAHEMNDSIATTSAAEAQIEARGFWQKLFFGGDTQAANSIQKEVTQNQTRIAELTQLLNSAGTSAEVKTALQAQITAMQQVQTALAAEAKAQTNLWGIFSWRLF